MVILKLCLAGAVSLIVLFLLSKLMGNKQISEMNMFDYVIGISIGSIAAEAATELEEFHKPMIAMVVYALLATLISYISMKSIKVRRVCFGKSRILYQDGIIYKRNLKKAHLDLNEVLMRCRTAGYFDLSQLSTILFEPNGKLSFLPRSVYRPATPADMSLVPQPEELQFVVVLDGKLLPRNLRDSGHDEKWLYLELKSGGIKNINDVFLATADSGKLYVYPLCEKKENCDLFE